MIFSFKKSLFIHSITWSVFKKYMDLAGLFDRGAHSELNVVKQLGTLELNRPWAHVPKAGKPSHPACAASSDKLQSCWCHHLDAFLSHTLFCFRCHTFLVWMSNFYEDQSFHYWPPSPCHASPRHFVCLTH